MSEDERLLKALETLASCVRINDVTKQPMLCVSVETTVTAYTESGD